MWQAQTPQMFRAGLLAEALRRCNTVTDEASAIEALGLQPKLVASDTSNFKVTYPQDIELAELLFDKNKGIDQVPPLAGGGLGRGRVLKFAPILALSP